MSTVKGRIEFSTGLLSTVYGYDHLDNKSAATIDFAGNSKSSPFPFSVTYVMGFYQAFFELVVGQVHCHTATAGLYYPV